MKIQNKIWGTILMLVLCMSAIAQTSANSTQANQSPSATSNAGSPDGQPGWGAKVPQQLKDLKSDTGDLRLMTERQIARLVAELRTGRTLSAEQDAEISALGQRLTAELANSASLEKSYASAVREIDSLRMALDFAKVALDSQKQTITAVTEQRDEARKAAGKANKRAAIATAAAVVLTILKFLL